MTDVFVDGRPFEGYFESAHGPMFVVALVSSEGPRLRLSEILFYPATSAPLHLEIAAVLSVLRTISEAARRQGFLYLTLEAERKKPGKPRRIVVIDRSLQ